MIFYTDLITRYMKLYGFTEEEFCKRNDIKKEDFDKVMKQDIDINLKDLQKIAKSAKLNTRELLAEDNFNKTLSF